jgi:hypothetical protein
VVEDRVQKKTRAYFTAACAISLLKISRQKSSLKLLPNQLILYKNFINFNNSYNLNKIQRNSINISNYQLSIFIGLLLSDGWLQKRKGWNPR